MPVGAVLSDKEIRFLSEHPAYIGLYTVSADGRRLIETEPLYVNRFKWLQDSNQMLFLCSQMNLNPEDLYPDYVMRAARHEIFEQNDIVNVSEKWKPMISPFEPKLIREVNKDGHVEKVISYGTSSYGYDIRASNQFKIFTNINNTVLDPKNFDEKAFVYVEAAEIIIPPHSFALSRSLERFYIPRNIITFCLAKSTLARLGLVIGVTPFEPEWEGYVTLEFSNTTSLPMKFYANEGCAQVLFLKGSRVCETSYADRGGKYQNQAAEPVIAKV